jgi:hypothetical protein
MIHVRRLRDAAAGEVCTFQIPGACNSDRSTTVLCHLPDESRGEGLKSDDISAAFGCSGCHAVIDRRATQPGLSTEEREWYMRRAQTRTLRRWIELGLVVIVGHKPRRG